MANPLIPQKRTGERKPSDSPKEGKFNLPDPISMFTGPYDALCNMIFVGCL